MWASEFHAMWPKTCHIPNIYTPRLVWYNNKLKPMNMQKPNRAATKTKCSPDYNCTNQVKYITGESTMHSLCNVDKRLIKGYWIKWAHPLNWLIKGVLNKVVQLFWGQFFWLCFFPFEISNFDHSLFTLFHVVFISYWFSIQLLIYFLFMSIHFFSFPQAWEIYQNSKK